MENGMGIPPDNKPWRGVGDLPALPSKRTTLIGVRIDASGCVAQFNALREL
jgi:hypothetical protein